MPRCGCPSRDDHRCRCVVKGGKGVVVVGDGTPRQNPYIVSLANPGPGFQPHDTDTLDLTLTDDATPTLSGDVRISDTANNALMHGDDGGLYVHTDGVSIKPAWSMVYQAAPQTIPNNERRALEWDAASSDGEVSGSALTVSDTGLWTLTPAMRLDGNFAANRISLWVAHADNSENRITYTAPVQFAEPTLRPGLGLTETVLLNKGDQISVFTLQVSGDARDTFTTYRSTRFTFAYLGPVN